jgi:predicted DNA-binding protein|tara:strand:- start:136 stop:345 length:210 start_codon:yes stop_codon:yes gene_type:complete
MSYNIVDIRKIGDEIMDTTRWKSVLVPREVYEEIKEMSKHEGRTIGGQLRVVFESYKEKLDERPDERVR